MSLTRVFIHGLEGSSQGTKGRFFREKYPDMIIEDFQGTLQQRMDKLDRLLCDKTSLILVGSSFGGVMGVLFACNNPRKVKKLVLLAPALTLETFEPYMHQSMDTPVVIYHGKNDVVIPFAPVHEIAGSLFKNLIFNVVDDDHVLGKTFKSMDWDRLLETKRAASRP